MNIDFEQLLLWATVISGALVLADVVWFAPRRKRQFIQANAQPPQPSRLIEYAHAFFPILLIVFLLRSFLFEPFRIPSGSLEPTLHMGDFILANKFEYGIRIPVLRTKVISLNEPQRGDIIVFRWPPNTHYYFIKRVIGLPGDRIDYINKNLIINGEKVMQLDLPILPVTQAIPQEGGKMSTVIEKQENLLGVQHHIYIEPSKTGANFEDIQVPAGMYMVMGDNRDNSADSRYWGFVPEENIVGKAVWIWMSWDSLSTDVFHKIRWNRIGKRIH